MNTVHLCLYYEHFSDIGKEAAMLSMLSQQNPFLVRSEAWLPNISDIQEVGVTPLTSQYYYN